MDPALYEMGQLQVFRCAMPEKGCFHSEFSAVSMLFLVAPDPIYILLLNAWIVGLESNEPNMF